VGGACKEGYLNIHMKAPEGYVVHAGVIDTSELAQKMGTRRPAEENDK